MTVRFLAKNQKAYARALALLLVVPVFLLSGQHGAALEMLHRSIRVTTSVPGSTADHIFGFDIRSSSNIGSIVFEYCSNSPLHADPCTAPTGLDASAVSIGQQAGETGFSLHGSSDNNTIILTRPPAAATPQAVMYRFNNVINPSAPRTSTFVRLSTHTADDGSGPRIDDGAVVFNTDGGLGAAAFVPPYLTFCVGLSVAPDCSSSAGSTLDMGILSTNTANTGSSQFAGATNDFTGYSVAVTGTTMTSGSNIIPALTTPAPSTIGSSQFGINLRANGTPPIGQNPTGAGSAAIAPNYNVPDHFTFNNGDNLASSSISTEFNVFTVSYLVNVSGAQPPGVYAATFTYIATAAF